MRTRSLALAHIPDGGARPFWKPSIVGFGKPRRCRLAFILTQTVPFSELTPGGRRYTKSRAVSSVTEFCTLLGLVVYTGSFIAEIVRAGIQAVPKGQVRQHAPGAQTWAGDADGDLAASCR